MSPLLPPLIAIKSSFFDSYLNYSYDSDTQKFSSLKFTGENVFSPLAKFEVVTATIGMGLVHIRCSHNKKFLRTAGLDDGYITAEADAPEEDQSKWSCTLFEPRGADDSPDNILSLFHVQRKLYTITGKIVSTSSPATRWFWVGEKESYSKDSMNVIDLKSLVILPRHVAFKGANDKYLGIEDQTPLFACTDEGAATAWFEVFTDGHGRVQIKSYKTKTLLRCDKERNEVSAETTDTKDDQTTFWPVKVDKNVVALRSFANGKFCGPIGDKAYLNSVSPTLSKVSRLVLEELVLSRSIYNTNFDLANAIIYGETPLTMATAIGSNNTNVDNTVVFKFNYTESKSNTWTASHAWKLGISVESKLIIPYFGGSKVTLSGEYSGFYQWGETLTSENTLETTYTAVVPANSSVTVSLMATKGTYDVPYSYYQRDVLYNGKTVVYKKDDGLFTGVNSYNFRYEVVQTSKDTSAGKSGTDEPTTITTYTEKKIVMPSEAAQGSLGKTIEENVHVPLPRHETSQPI